MIYEPVIEKLMQHFTANSYAEEVPQAKEEFFKRAGIFDEESHDFEMKMAQFADWYLFTRKLSAQGIPPVKMEINLPAMKMSEDEITLYRNLQNSRHSLFEFLKLKGDDVHVRDLFSGYKLVIQKSPVTIGFSKDEIFEARLIPHDDSFIFSGAFCFHPPQASRFIHKEIKKIKKLPDDQRDEAREQFIARLFRMRYKFDQYRHVRLDMIYSNDSKLGL